MIEVKKNHQKLNKTKYFPVFDKNIQVSDNL